MTPTSVLRAGLVPGMNLLSNKKRFISFRMNKNPILYSWNFIFNHEVSPLRKIPDIAIRHYVLQALGLMWALSFSLAIGSYTFLAASIVGHTLLIGALAITVAVLSTAAAKPELCLRSSRRHDGEHE